MKRLLLILSFVFGLAISTQAQGLTRSQLDQIIYSAKEQVNTDMQKNYTMADAYLAYQNGYLSILYVGKVGNYYSYRYNYLGCVNIVLIDDR